MKPFYNFSDVERASISNVMLKVTADPYKDYRSFAAQVKYRIDCNRAVCLFGA